MLELIIGSGEVNFGLTCTVNLASRIFDSFCSESFALSPLLPHIDAMTRRRKSSIAAETALVDAQLQILRRREAEAQKILDGMQRMQNNIRSERVALEMRTLTLEAEAYPISWLPNELLLDIFIALLDTEHNAAQTGAGDVNPLAPMVLSHVSQKWRELSLSTSQLWTRLLFPRGRRWSSRLLVNFMQRSGSFPLDVVFDNVGAGGQHISTMIHLLDMYDITRVRSFVIRCEGATAMEEVVHMLNSAHLPILHTLDLSCTAQLPLGSMDTVSDSIIQQRLALHELPRPSSLKRLRFQNIPSLCLPLWLVSTITSLELCYPAPGGTSTFKATTLLGLLSSTPQLEELLLHNSVPLFDITLGEDGVPAALDSAASVQSVQLSQLRRLEWSYPSAYMVFRLLSFLILPSLEKFDVWVDPDPRPVHTVSPPRVFPVDPLLFSSLKDLSIQYVDEDAITSIVRRFTLSSLTKLEITNVDTSVRKPGDVTLSVLPRIESIFRDPRLPYLTHLTLSHLEISRDNKADVMLGYMPVLASLSLDSCIGVEILLEALTLRVPLATRSAEGRIRKRGVRFCPRLEALAFWGCGEITFEEVRAVVMARNAVEEEQEEAAAGGGRSTDPEIEIRENGNGTNGKHEDGGVDVVAGRKIRPLRKTVRRQVQGQVAAGLDGSPSSSATPWANIIAMQEVSEPASIIYVRVEDCATITEEKALSLKENGVVDVVWSGLS